MPGGGALRLIAHPHLERGGFHLDRFDAFLDGELIVTSRQPLLNGARALLARGFDPDAMLTMRHAGRAYDSFHPKPLREWARWTITERDRRGLQRIGWRPFADASGSHAVASSRGENGLAEGEAAETSRRRSRYGPGTSKGTIGQGQAVSSLARLETAPRELAIAGRADCSTRDGSPDGDDASARANLCPPATALPGSSMWEGKRRGAGAASRARTGFNS
jgi:hypothetical protein